jgi:hypothetical protein
MLDHWQHWSFIKRQFIRSQEWNRHSETISYLSDFRIFRAQHHVSQPVRIERGLNCVSKQWLTTQQSGILTWNALRTSASWNETKNSQD